MTSQARGDLTQDSSSMRQMMDRHVNDPRFAGANAPHAAPRRDESGHNVAVDVIERETTYIVSASVPGVKPEDIEVVLVKNVLTIKGECKLDPAAGEDTYHLRERLRGNFSRCIVFPTAINAARVETACENGVLTLVLPKGGYARPTAIDAQPGPSRNGNANRPRGMTQLSPTGQPGAPGVVHS